MQKKHIYIIAALLFVLAAYFSQGVHHYDEHHQVMEFAGLKLGLTEKANLPWEYAAQMRPAIQPMMVYVTHKIFGLINIDSPFTISFLLRLFTAALSFLSIHLLIKAFIDTIQGDKLKLSFILLSFFLWFSVYNSVRFSSENLAGRVFVIAFALFFIWKNLSKKQYFAIGLLLGLSFLFRYQNAFLMVGFLAWIFFINKSKFSEMLLIAAGIVAMFGVGILIDHWFYNEWVLTSWKYFEQNILLNKAAEFGVEPWYYYFAQIVSAGIPPFSLLFVIPLILILIFKRKDALVWTVVPFVAAHMYISHKELRFLFPLIGFLPLIIVSSGEIINAKWKGFSQSKFLKVSAILFWIYNGLFLAISVFKPADAQVPLYHKIYNDYPQATKVYWIEGNPYSRALDVYYYKRKNLRIEKINALSEMKLSADTTVLFASNTKEEQAILGTNNKVIYASFPEWIKMFNVAGWVDRTNFRKVYEIQHLPNTERK